MAMGEENKPVTNPELKQAIAHMYQEGTRDSQVAALQSLSKAKLLAPVIVSQREKEKIRFMLLPTQDGRNFLPVFTDVDELKKHFSDSGQQTLILTFADCANMILRDNSAVGVVVNPFGDSLTLGREMVEFVVGSMGALKTHVRLSGPDPWPERLVRAISNQAALLTEVRRVWLCRAEDADGAWGYLLLVECAGRTDGIFEALAQAARPYLDGVRADIAIYDVRYEAAVRNIEPIYQ